MTDFFQKTQRMFINKLLVLFLFAIATFSSCDGRDRKFKTNAEVLKENKLYEKFIEQVELVPVSYTEIVTDTILSSGFKVKLKYHSLNNDFVLKTNKKISKQTQYKNFQAELKVFKNGLPLTRGIINKNIFSEFNNQDFLDKAIMQFVWIDFESSTDKFVVLNTSLKIPETNQFKDFVLYIYENGSTEIIETNLTPNMI